MSVSLPIGQSARSASILVVDDEPDVADPFSPGVPPRGPPGNLCDAFRGLGRGGVGSARR